MMKTNPQPSLFDVVIVGGGVVGCAIARELSRFRLKVALVEKEADVASGASGRNSGVVHAGFNNPVGSLKARFCVEGNAGFEAICRELGVPYKKTGKLVVALESDDLPLLDRLIAAGEANRVPDLKLIDQDEIRRREPHINGIRAMFSGSTAITSPFLLTVALAENAFLNGVRFFFESPVTRITKKDGRFLVRAGTHCFETTCVINSAGIYADAVAALAGVTGFRLYPCRGQYHILDKKTSAWLNMPVYPVPRPGASGLGVHLTPTVEGNVLIGPSAEYIGDKIDHATTREVMSQLTSEARELFPVFSPKYIIRSYSGIRPKRTSPKQGGGGDFLIEDSATVPGLINLIGIESPGLTSAVPISHLVRDLAGRYLPLKEKADFQPRRRGMVRFAEAGPEERARLIREDPDYGEMVCRCESVSKKEVLEAIKNPLGVHTLSGIKYRARCLMGRCQGGYCLTRIVDLLIRETGLAPEEISLRGHDSTLFTGNLK